MMASSSESKLNVPKTLLVVATVQTVKYQTTNIIEIRVKKARRAFFNDSDTTQQIHQKPVDGKRLIAIRLVAKKPNY